MTHRRLRIVLCLTSAAVLAACSQMGAPSFQPVSSANGISRSSPLGFGYRLLHNFGKGSDGNTPASGLISLNGKFYGTTQYGGRGGNGTVYSITVGGTETVLHSFGKPPDGEDPDSDLIAANGALYGTTEFGGSNNFGTVYTVTTAGKENVIHNFSSGADGANPMAGLVAVQRGKNVELYGTTSAGGQNGKGTVFRMKIPATQGSSGSEEVIHSFGGAGDGAAPEAGLVARGKVLYGTTSAGGSGSDGTAFEMTTGGTETLSVGFNCTDGRDPVATLVDLSGGLYGTAATGGNSCQSSTSGDGTVFGFSDGGNLHAIYTFAGGSKDGDIPKARLIGVRGILFGTTYLGGEYGVGTLFSMSPAGRETILHSFGSETDGTKPLGTLVRVHGAFYGTTSAGGKYGGGTVFVLNR